MLQIVSGGKRLLFFYKPVCPSDLLAVKRQMRGRNFDPAIVLGAAAYCRFGQPSVIVCSPLSGEDIPFPTTFWLTCPRLNRSIGALESEGGVGELEAWLAAHVPVGEWRRFDMDHRLARMALLPPDRLSCLRGAKPQIWGRVSGDGVGGTRYDGKSPVRVKCIHLQTASWLAFGRHPAEEWLKARGLGQSCGDGQCIT